MKNIYIIGFMGVGKSTVCDTLKKMLNKECAEMDQLIVEQQGMAISEIFDKYGENGFRDIETQLVKDLGQKEDLVISCGGGAVLRDENAADMKAHGNIVLLTATPETIYGRVKNSKDRPLLNGNMNVDYIRGLMEKRRPRYEEVADLMVSTDGKNVREICQEIITKLGIQ
ncbi:MAG: shikimate kinase [Roseburia sp.]